MKILGVIETAIDVEDLDVAVSFYQRLFDFETLLLDERFCAFNVGGRSVLLLFKTMLYLLGLDHEKLTYRYSGRDFRLTDLAGVVARGVLA